MKDESGKRPQVADATVPSPLNRSFTPAHMVSQVRAAELLTLDFERVRLKNLGIDLEPKWISLEDCFAGYDILSYDLGETAPINRMIGVESALTSPLRFTIARSKWRRSQESGPAYLFHVWDMETDPPVLYELTAAQLSACIPRDSGEGRWLTVEILLDDLH